MSFRFWSFLNSGSDSEVLPSTNVYAPTFLFYPWYVILLPFTQKTFIQDWTGHWELWDLQGLCLHHLQVRGWIFCIFMTLCLRLGQWGHRECQSVRAQDCGHHELSFKACWGLSRCSVTRTARCIVGTALRKHRSRSDHFIHTEVCSRRRTHIHGHTYCHWNVFSWTVSK